MRLSIVTVCALLAGAYAAPASGVLHKRYAVHEKRHHIPSRWKRSVKVNSDALLPVRIALAQQNLERAEEYLMDVADPASPNFGKHWTAKQVADTFAASVEAVEAVTAWLIESGISNERINLSQGRNRLDVDLTVAEAEELLQATYYEFLHANGQSAVACNEYSVPAHVQPHVDFITPTLHFDAKVSGPITKRDERSAVRPGIAKQIGSPSLGPKSGGRVPSHRLEENKELAHCNETITPDCLRALYGLPAHPETHPKNSYGIVEYTPQAYLQSDLDKFFANFTPQLVGTAPKLASIDGGYAQTNQTGFDYNGESDLDLQYGMSLSYPQPITLYQTGDIVEGASFNNFLDAIDASYCSYEGGDDPTQDGIYPDNSTAPGSYKGPESCGTFKSAYVISTSYSYNEHDLTPYYETRQCNEYMKLGLQGITFLYSSGDYGVAGNTGACIDPATGNYNNGTDGRFTPGFPGTCPYITSVGATQVKNSTNLAKHPTPSQPEMAAESVIYSGGGFSDVFAMPKYQKAAVRSYFEKYPPPYSAAQYNNSQTTRGFPDLSANGVNYAVAVDGEWEYVFGTSASSPTVGAILTAVNAKRFCAGKGPIGFINPTLYAHPEMLTDITAGGNQGCGTPGFESVPGWDPVTGLGTPIFDKMVDVWLSLP